MKDMNSKIFWKKIDTIIHKREKAAKICWMGGLKRGCEWLTTDAHLKVCFLSFSLVFLRKEF